MKTKLLLFLLIFSPFALFAQFEQKVTLNFSPTFVIPELNVDAEDIQYNYGVGLEGGLQYNFNRRISLMGNVRFYYTDGIYGDVYNDNIAAGLGLKLNMAPSRRINPYLFAEANLNFLWYQEWIDPKIDAGEIIQPGYYDDDFATSLGGNGGIGLDFRMGENFSIFLQTSLYYVTYDGLLNNLIQGGIRVSMFKSKTI